MPTMDPYNEIALVLLTAVVVGMAGFKLRQPLIICFLLAGILVGPSGLRIIHGHHDMDSNH